MANHGWRFCARRNRRWSSKRWRQENCYRNIKDLETEDWRATSLRPWV
jgi:hypothetical protein